MEPAKPATVFCDLDGCLLRHANLYEGMEAEALPAARQKLLEWHAKSVRIILVTGRPESLREQTIRDLNRLGLIWDQILFGCGSGPRYLINDMKNGSQQSAFAINLVRDAGLSGVDIP